jgi:ribosomal protein L11 methyltransferase
MSWLSVQLQVDETQVEALSDALMEAGALAVDVQDAQAGTAGERAIFAEPGSTPATAWQNNRLSALFDAGVDVDSIVAQVLRDCGCPPDTPLAVQAVADTDWVRLTQSQFQPIRISSRLWIVPTWHRTPDPSALNIVLDPGVAFGTGAHPTTRLCLRWLEDVVTSDTDVLDYGCGSGILAIAAMKFGARTASGIDIDPQALLAAHANALQNRVVCEFRDAGAAQLQPFSVVVANILANPLRVLAPLLAEATLPGGQLALAGILDAQAEEVMAYYEPFFDMRIHARDEGWSLLTGRRR